MTAGVRPFGELEAAIMRVVWEHDVPISVRTIVDRLNQERGVAYTTVITVAERLREKGMLTRVRRGRAFLYEAFMSAEDFSADLMRQVLDSSESRSATLLRFAGQLSSEESASLRAALARSGRGDAAEKAE